MKARLLGILVASITVFSATTTGAAASEAGAAQGENQAIESSADFGSIEDQLAAHIANTNPAGGDPRSGLAPGLSRGSSAQAAGTTYQYKLDNIQYNVQHTKLLDSCQNGGGTCTLSRTVSFTNTTSGGFGISAAGISANLSLGYSSTYSTTASCTSPKLTYRQTFIVRPIGTFVNYTVAKRTFNGTLAGTEKGTAFFATGIKCSVVAS